MSNKIIESLITASQITGSIILWIVIATSFVYVVRHLLEKVESSEHSHIWVSLILIIAFFLIVFAITLAVSFCQLI